MWIPIQGTPLTISTTKRLHTFTCTNSQHSVWLPFAVSAVSNRGCTRRHTVRRVVYACNDAAMMEWKLCGEE